MGSELYFKYLLSEVTHRSKTEMGGEKRQQARRWGGLEGRGGWGAGVKGLFGKDND